MCFKTLFMKTTLVLAVLLKCVNGEIKVLVYTEIQLSYYFYRNTNPLAF